MSQSEIIDLFSNAMYASFKMVAPILIASVAIGLLVAIFQAATQIHEQTLTFVPKVIVIAFMLLILGSWMMNIIIEFGGQLTIMQYSSKLKIVIFLMKEYIV